MKPLDEDFDKIKAFSSKVLMYLWNDVVKYNRDYLFDKKYRTFEELEVGFATGRLSVFGKFLGYEE